MRLTSNIDIFFALLRSGLYGVPIPAESLPDHIEWKEIARIAEKQTVLGTIIDSIQFLPDRLRPTGTTAAKLNAYALGLIKTNLILDRTAAKLVRFFADHGISGVLLKGQGIARNYRQPQMRQPGDIDFYVGKKAYPEAVALCKKHLIGADDETQEYPKHFSFTLDGVIVELHRYAARLYSPFKMKSFQQWLIAELEHSPARRTIILDNTEVTLPSVNCDVLYIFYHAWLHFIMGGIGLRQLCDWAMIFHNHGNEIDKQQLIANLRRFGLVKGWKLFGCIAVDYLGVPADKMPLYDPTYRKRSEKILDEILAGGNFGFYSKEYESYAHHKYGVGYGLAKVPAVTKYFFSLVTLIPAEATFLFLNRLYNGALSSIKSSLKRD